MMKHVWGMKEYIPEFSFITDNKSDIEMRSIAYPNGYISENFNMDLMKKIIDNFENNYVIKASGLKSGKGVKVSGDHLKSVDDSFQILFRFNTK